MKKVLLATSCLAVSVTTMTYDVSRSSVIAAPAFTWTGFYAGANVGGATMTAPAPGVSNVESTSTFAARAMSMGSANNGLNGTGGVAGGQLGYNYQQGNWVFGVEGEGYWSGIKLTNTTKDFNSDGSLFSTFGSSIANNSDFTIAARIGWAFDRTMIYGKGGWAWGSFKANSFESCCNANPFTSSANFSGTLDGFLVGIGAEHALTRNWTVKLEYNYIAFGNKEVALNQCNTSNICAQVGTTSFSATKQIFKVGANYLFNIGGP